MVENRDFFHSPYTLQRTVREKQLRILFFFSQPITSEMPRLSRGVNVDSAKSLFRVYARYSQTDRQTDSQRDRQTEMRTQ